VYALCFMHLGSQPYCWHSTKLWISFAESCVFPIQSAAPMTRYVHTIIIALYQLTPYDAAKIPRCEHNCRRQAPRKVCGSGRQSHRDHPDDATADGFATAWAGINRDQVKVLPFPKFISWLHEG